MPLKVVILAGGFGTRLAEETDLRPKPMVEIGGWPILWHIMKMYASHGFTEFVLALGYRGDSIKRFFVEYSYATADLTVSTKEGQVTVHRRSQEDWTVHLVDTGLHTMTGGRLRRLAPWISDAPFLMTYGDGVSDVDITALVRFHASHGKMATVTSVRPTSRFGKINVNAEGDVLAFVEKPDTGEGWINGGFFVLDPGVLALIEADETHWEREPMEQLANTNQLRSFPHEGFWHSMDTLRDVRALNERWTLGSAPWKTWPD